MNLYKVGYTLISVVYHRMFLYKRTDRIVETGFFCRARVSANALVMPVK